MERPGKKAEHGGGRFQAVRERLGERLLPLIVLGGLALALTLGWDLVLFVLDRAGGLERQPAYMTSVFFRLENLGNIFRQNSHYGILAVGMTFVIITAGIDLSVGSVLAFSSVVAASIIAAKSGQGNGLALLAVSAGVGSGAALGLFNGVLITYSKALPGWIWRKGRAVAKKESPPPLGMVQVQPFIITLAMMSMARGFAFLWSGGRGIDIYGVQPPLFEALGKDLEIGPLALPWPGIIFLAVTLASALVLNRTRFGRHVYATGSNETAALLSGISAGRIKIAVYGISGALAGLAAMVYTSIQNSGRPDDGVGFELDAIAAAVIGGTSLMGGRGSAGGTLIGALIIGVLNNVLALRGIDPNLQRVLKGAIIVAAVLLQRDRD